MPKSGRYKPASELPYFYTDGLLILDEDDDGSCIGYLFKGAFIPGIFSHLALDDIGWVKYNAVTREWTYIDWRTACSS